MTTHQGILKVALLQYAAGEDKAANLAKATRMAREALDAGAQFVLLPEVCNLRGDTRRKEVLKAAAETIPGPTTKAFMSLARKYKASILLGSIIEKTNASRAYNTSVFISPNGKITAKYRKINLFDARIGDKIVRESECFLEGKRTATAKVGCFKAGLSICYDLRFPAMYGRYAKQKVDVLTVPACFTRKTGQAHWEVLLRARAIENLCYVLAPNQVGTDVRGMQAHGHSMIISPWGKVIACGSSDGEEIIYGHIDAQEVQVARQILPGIIK